MVRTCNQIKWPLQKDRIRHRTRDKIKIGRHRKIWKDSIRETTGLDINSSQRAAEDRQGRQEIVVDANSGAPTTLVPGYRLQARCVT